MFSPSLRHTDKTSNLLDKLNTFIYLLPWIWACSCIITLTFVSVLPGYGGLRSSKSHHVHVAKSERVICSLDVFCMDHGCVWMSLITQEHKMWNGYNARFAFTLYYCALNKYHSSIRAGACVRKICFLIFTVQSLSEGAGQTTDR